MAVQAQYAINSNYPFPQDLPSFKTEPVFEHQEQQINANGSRKRNRAIQALPLPPPSQEFDAIINLHNAKLKSGLEEIRKRQWDQFVQILESVAKSKITEKDAEIEILKARQSELEAALSQVAAESQIWFTVARNSDAVVLRLRASLDQVLRRRSECHAAIAQAEDAGSCCYGGGGDESCGRRSNKAGSVSLCRVCGERDVSVVVVPCRHLCLCLECEPATYTCPICRGGKNIGLQVFLE